MNGYKVHHGMPVNTKLAVIAKRAGLRRGEVLALWIILLDHASRNTPRGSVSNIDTEEVAATLEFESALVEAAFQAFRDKGVILSNDTLSDWEKSQKLSSTLRTREHRARQRKRTETPLEIRNNDKDDDSEAESARRRQRLRDETLARHKKHGPSMTKKL